MVNSPGLFAATVPDRDPHSPRRFSEFPHKFLVGVYRAKSGHHGEAAWGAFPAGTDLQTLTSEEGKNGSYALGNVHREVEFDLYENYAAYIIDVINNQFIPSIIKPNWGPRRWTGPASRRLWSG